MNQEQVIFQQNKKVLATMVVSPIASIVGKYVVHPIDTIRSKIQARAEKIHSLSQYRLGHSIQLTKLTWKNQGIRGFFPGVTISAFGSIIAYSVYLAAYERTKFRLQKYPFFQDHSAVNHLIAGFAAEFFSCIFWLPIDIIKQRLQVQSEVKIYNYSGPRQAMRKIHLTEGIIGLYRAFGATLLFFGPTSALFFMAYQELKERIVKDQKSPTVYESIICSMGASAFSGYITTPLEMVKLRMQIQRADSAMKGVSLEKTLYGYRNIFHGLYQVYKKQGFLALYKGGGLRVLSCVPSFSVQMSLVEWLRNIVLKRNLIDKFVQ